MQFGFLGINYKNAALNIRDKIAFTDGKKLQLFQKAEAAGICQCMALSTCNRSEIYFLYEEESQIGQIHSIYQSLFPEIDVSRYAVSLTGKEAIAYLFCVAAGLESLVLGEDQILGQVKDALDDSKAMGYSGKELNRIVRDAVTCAKRVKTEFKISEKPLSVSYIGIQKLKEACPIAGKRILVIGSGKTAHLALQYLYEYPDVSVIACSRTYAHASRLREAFPNLAILPYEKRYCVIGDCDIVVSATSAPHLTVKREAFAPKRPVTFLDLAAPRDVDTAFLQEPFAQLINLDTLYAIAKENQKERERLVEESKKRMEEKQNETLLWLHQSHMDATIESLQQRCNEIVEDSYAYLSRKMELGKREQNLIKKTLHASLQRLLREPILELKQLESEDEQKEYKRLVGQLFQI